MAPSRFNTPSTSNSNHIQSQSQSPYQRYLPSDPNASPLPSDPIPSLSDLTSLSQLLSAHRKRNAASLDAIEENERRFKESYPVQTIGGGNGNGRGVKGGGLPDIPLKSSNAKGKGKRNSSRKSAASTPEPSAIGIKEDPDAVEVDARGTGGETSLAANTPTTTASKPPIKINLKRKRDRESTSTSVETAGTAKPAQNAADTGTAMSAFSDGESALSEAESADTSATADQSVASGGGGGRSRGKSKKARGNSKGRGRGRSTSRGVASPAPQSSTSTPNSQIIPPSDPPASKLSQTQTISPQQPHRSPPPPPPVQAPPPLPSTSPPPSVPPISSSTSKPPSPPAPSNAVISSSSIDPPQQQAADLVSEDVKPEIASTPSVPTSFPAVLSSGPHDLKDAGQPASLEPQALIPGANGANGTGKMKLKLKLAPRPVLPPAPSPSSAIPTSRPPLPQMSSSTRSSAPVPKPTPIHIPREWTLPTLTPETFVPQLPRSLIPTPGPTKPTQVHDDFANRDWKELERARISGVSSTGTTNDANEGGSTDAPLTAVGRGRAREQTQTPLTTFYTYADAFLKTLSEDDLAWLSSKSDDLEPFQMPPLGRHYKDVWQDEDSGIANANGTLNHGRSISGAGQNDSGSRTGFEDFAPQIPTLQAPNGINAAGMAAGSSNNQTLVSAPAYPPENATRFDPRQLRDEHLGNYEIARAGPLTERVLAALVPSKSTPNPDTSNGSAQAEGQDSDVSDMRGGSHSGGNFERERERERERFREIRERETLGIQTDEHGQDMVEFEERIRRELKHLDVLGPEELDWQSRTDDDISAALRSVQKALHKQMRVNEARKARLFDIAMDRMAYQDYVACLNTVEKEIEAGWNKRQRQIKNSLGKKKKSAGVNTSAASGSGTAPVSTEQQPQQQAPPPQFGINPGAKSVPGMEVSALPPTTQSQDQSQSQNSTVNSQQANQIQPPTSSSSSSYGPSKPHFPESLLSALESRRKLKFAFAPMFEKCQHAWRTPQADEDIYEDLGLDLKDYL